jgi:hypothetical protein
MVFCGRPDVDANGIPAGEPRMVHRFSDRETIEAMARVGYGARGMVYLIVGGLATTAALGSGGGRPAGTKGALESLFAQPFGSVLVGIVAVGLACFACWRLVQAILDPEGHEDDAKEWARRAGYVVGAVIYAGLAVFALSLILGGHTGSGDEDRSARDWTAWLLSKPLGAWLVGAVGLTIIGTGIAVAVKGWKAKFEQRLALDAPARRWAVPLGRFGLVARGAVFVLIGGFLVLAAWHGSSSDAKGLSGALRSLQQQPYGGALYGLTALGLLAFGAYGVVQAMYRRITAPSVREFAARARAAVPS